MGTLLQPWHAVPGNRIISIDGLNKQWWHQALLLAWHLLPRYPDCNYLLIAHEQQIGVIAIHFNDGLATCCGVVLCKV